MTGLSDFELTALYMRNGLFARIIDTPADVAAFADYRLTGIDDHAAKCCRSCLDGLEWQEKAAAALKWARLFGGAVLVVIADDGFGIDEPLSLPDVRTVESLQLYDRTTVFPILNEENAIESFRIRSRSGEFIAHSSRCLMFRNGVLPENTNYAEFELWGMPEHFHIAEELTVTISSHESAAQILTRRAQPVYKVKNLSKLLSTADGERELLHRLELLDLSRSIFGTVGLDAGDDLAAVIAGNLAGSIEAVRAAERILCAVTRIPDHILFGTPEKHPLNGKRNGQYNMTVREAWQNYITEIQHKALMNPLHRLVMMLLQAECGRTCQSLSVEFSPVILKTGNDVDGKLKKAQAELVRAQTLQTYYGSGALSIADVKRDLKQRGSKEK